jgi:hypothetical protein
MTLVMQDSISAGALTPGADAYAGYVDGNPAFRSFAGIVARFYPKAHCFSITVRGGEAACADCETGNMTPEQAGPWVREMLHLGHWRPCVYANASTMPAVQASLAGIPRGSYRLWVAAFPGAGPSVPAGFDGHQWADHGPHGENYDRSVLRDDFFPEPKPKPKPVPKPHPKVTAAAIAGALVTALQAFAHAHGINLLHLTTAESSAITTCAAVLAAYLKPA